MRMFTETTETRQLNHQCTIKVLAMTVVPAITACSYRKSMLLNIRQEVNITETIQYSSSILK